jgi:hypothetical protein
MFACRSSQNASLSSLGKNGRSESELRMGVIPADAELTKDGKYCYNLLGLKQSYVEGSRAVPKGQHKIHMEFAYDGGGICRGGKIALYIGGERVGAGRGDATQPMVFSAD